MHFSTALIALVAAELGTTAAIPAGNHIQKRSFSVSRVATGHVNRDIAAEMRKAYSKYSFNVPDALAATDEDCAPSPPAAAGASLATGTAAASHAPLSTSTAHSGNGTARGQVGNATNTPLGNDVQYDAPVTIGGQTFMMNFDTGSSDLWVFGANVPTQDVKSRPTFNQTNSPTFKPMVGSTFAVRYADKSFAAGNVVGTDEVSIGGATATGQTVEVASSVGQMFTTNNNVSGLVGLAFGKINTVKPAKATTFFETIQDQLAQPIMVANLKHNTSGSYSFGETDPTQFKGDLAWAPVNGSSGFWQFESARFAVGNQPLQPNPNAGPAIADTGTTLLIVDDAVATAYWKQVPGAQQAGSGGFFFPCRTQLPDLQLAVGPSYMANIPGHLLDFGAAKGGNGDSVAVGDGRARRSRGSIQDSKRDWIVEIGFGQTGQPQPAQPAQPASTAKPAGQMCQGALQSNQGNGMQIYGDIFFKAQYTVFNVGNSSLGVAPHA